ncbi:processed acidic surface protein [Alkalihalobacillus sp. MEB130]|uniref:processed acidic surface protein n=1 Tax=Alkalihalobacillus sp. MEB130 TaxID=2976704 RepID=UPI0028DD57FF|nr:processed acidic surface protein [Alkalihalobacillus sp. MEB130]MDT8860345.1 processed acidic surface protein [Alkalihalobacillus sp. MEB130]
MKRLFMSLVVVLGLLALPFNALAAPTEAEVEEYVSGIGWSVEELEEYLDFYDLTLEDFYDLEDLTYFLGEVLTEESLMALLDEYGLTLEEATALLIENGELEEGQAILDVYTFVDDLDIDLYFYNLTPLTDENLEELLEKYELTMDELLSLLEEHGDSLEYYEHVEDLDWAIEYYLYYYDEDYYDEDIVFSDIDDLFEQLGLTYDELERLFKHFLTLDLENPAFLDRLDKLSERMMAFEDFDEASDVTPEQIAELLDIFTQLLDLFEMDVKFYLVKGDEKQSVSLATLMTMTSTDGYDLLIELYNKQGELLADLVFTADMFGSEIITETGKDLKKTEEVIVKQVEKKEQKTSEKKKPVTKTERGAKLPKTASDYVANTAGGLVVALAGILLYRRFKVKGA